ncbi:MAG TPA: hypothetical protein VLD62_00130 [Acidimicrobiia bacterium]|nr:hypothetical protein [Acidimicrobiia bacterium]
MKPRIAGVLVLLAGVVACGGPSDGGSVTSTPPGFVVSGYVHAGPVCPVERTPPDPACADRPVEDAVIEVETADGTWVARIQTGEDGTFSVVLPPAAYTFSPQPVEGLMGTAPEAEVVVIDADLAGVDIAYDTGIR